MHHLVPEKGDPHLVPEKDIHPLAPKKGVLCGSVKETSFTWFLKSDSTARRGNNQVPPIGPRSNQAPTECEQEPKVFLK